MESRFIPLLAAMSVAILVETLVLKRESFFAPKISRRNAAKLGFAILGFVLLNLILRNSPLMGD